MKVNWSGCLWNTMLPTCACPYRNHRTPCSIWQICLCLKRGIIQSNIDRILWKVNQVIYTLDTICEPIIVTLAQAVLQVFYSQCPLWVKCPSPKREIIQSNFDRILWKVNQVIYIMYRNCMPDIMMLAQAVLQLFCSQGCFTTQNDKSRKREIIQSNMYRILPKVNQVIYTLDTICEPNIMILAQPVLEIFCSQGPLWVKCPSPKREIIGQTFDRILWKVNQVIYIMYPNCMPDIMMLAQAVLQLFCSQGCFTTQNDKSWKREIIQSNIYWILPKVNQVIYTLDTICEPNIMILAQPVLSIFCSQGPLWVKCPSLKRGIIQSNFDRILWKVNQVIYIMYPNCMPDIMIVLLIFCSQGCFTA